MGLFSSLLPVAGTIAGGAFGGPAGAMIGGSIGSGIGGAFDQRGNEKRSRRSQEEANRYLEQINGIGRNAFEPYIGPGLEAGNRANEEYSSLLDDPTGFINKIMQSYKPSEGYSFQKDELGRELGNTAAAGGFAGTQYDQNVRGKLIQSLLSKDMQQYLENVTGAHGAGLIGKEHVADRGFNASSNLADFLGSNLGQQAGLAYRGGNERNANRADYNNSMLNLGGNIAGTIGEKYFPRKPVAGNPGQGPVKGGYGGPYRSSAPGAAWGA